MGGESFCLDPEEQPQGNQSHKMVKDERPAVEYRK